ncbi:Rho GTPase activating protein [Sporothrix stenoceras]
MAGPSTAPLAEANGAPRNASIDSGVSALSNSSTARKNSTDSVTTHDIPSIIKAAGSAEAVIEHLLKEKQAQSQQNAQLWRLVDKQRAMILGLNKDLERALKDKEKYRRKVKEFLPDHGRPPVPLIPESTASQQQQKGMPGSSAQNGSTSSLPALSISTMNRVASEDVPSSPVSVKDSPVHSPLQSPVDMSLAPYPITPPADQPSIAAASAVGGLLDPVESMPRPQDHALDNFDHEAEDRAADSARHTTNAANDIPISFSLPPSRSLPSKPPQVPPPQIPSASSEDGGASQFPPPPAPPPRKPPPAPLLLRDPRPSPTIPIDDEVLESDSDYDSLLEVTEIAEKEKRGRRRTREEDDREREILAIQEAEIRSLSKKSKKSNSAHGTPKSAGQPTAAPDTPPNSLDGMLNSDGADINNNVITVQRSLAAPLLSPGLPSSPRPMTGNAMPRSPLHSPPLSPRMGGNFGSAGAAPLSPRPPRQPIPLPPNTPLQTPSPAPGEPLMLSSPKPLNIIKKSSDTASSNAPSSPSVKSVKSVNSRETPTERTRIFKGFVTEEFPDLLLPPNALPSIDIKVASSRMKPSRASLISLTQLEEDPVFTLAIFSRADGGELWRVEKDSASLAKLDQRLKQCPAFTARTPDRSLFSGHAPAKLDARRQALNYYLDELLNTQLDNPTAMELCRYLSTNTLPPNADETGSTSAEVRKEAQANKAKINFGDRPVKTGYLTKRGKNFGGWKARFFVLDGPHLKYYETPGGAHLGTIKLQNAQIGKQSQHNETSSPARGGANNNASDDFDNQYRHAFLILEPKKKDPSALTKHVLCAESDHERDLWVDSLLRWIDYRDEGDDDDTPSISGVPGTLDPDRPSSSNDTRPNGSNTKKRQNKKQQQKPQISSPQLQTQPQQSFGKDGLIGVSYEATQQGEIPHGVPGNRQRRNSQDSDMPQTMSSQSPYAISAPRDPQVISDSSAWGGRAAMLGTGLAPPSVDEKKARKRSFFGFGAKTRTSSDGPSDSLFGDSNSGGPAGSSNGGGGGGPNRQVFGAPLAEAARYNSPVDVNVPLPAVVYRCIQYLEARNAVYEEGIFRLSGSNVLIKQLRERFNNESDVNLLTDTTYHDIHAVASLLKMYLRELPTTILTRDLHMQFLSVTEMSNQEEKLSALAELATHLPQANATLLKYLVAFLIRIINNSDRNKMTVRNVGIVFSPTLNIPAPVFALLLQNYEAIFGIEPEEYELPSSVSDDPQNRRPSLSSMSTGATIDPLPQRPSTSHAGESPHRQRLLDAVKNGGNGGRNTQTPPPVLMSSAGSQMQSRSGSTPTPPPMQPPPSFPLPKPLQQQQQRMTTYEPQYLSQQQGNSQVSLRPAYESGFVLPAGYDPMQLPASNPVRNNPGYDRPLYEGSSNGGLAAYERNTRRESAILPSSPAMNLNNNQQQGGRRPGPGNRY